MEEQRSNINLSQFCNNISKCGVKNFKKKILDLSDRKHDWKLKWGHLMIMFTEANWELYNGHTDLTIHSASNNVSSWEQCVCVSSTSWFFLQQQRSSQKVGHYYQGKKNWKGKNKMIKQNWVKQKQTNDRKTFTFASLIRLCL